MSVASNMHVQYFVMAFIFKNFVVYEANICTSLALLNICSLNNCWLKIEQAQDDALHS
jgi:hypothetical protein